jgi:hypothetical protein
MRTDLPNAVRLTFVLCLIFDITIVQGCAAAKTNSHEYFLTDDGDTVVFTNGVLTVRPEKLEQARKAQDSRPASEDSQGHWGKIVQSCQISLRISKKSFAVGEPIPVVVLFRNVNPASLSDPPEILSAQSFDIPLGIPQYGTQLLVTTSQGQPVSLRNAKEPRNFQERLQMLERPRWLSLLPGMQRRYFLELRTLFELTKGNTYTIQVSHTNRTFETPAVVNSAKVTIEIIK